MLQFNRIRLANIKPFVFFSVIMIMKIYLVWTSIFDGVPAWGPLLKEIPFIWVLFCLIEWFSSKRKIGLYLTVNLIVTAIFFAAVMYHKYYGVIVNYTALQQVNQVTAVKNSVFSLLAPYYLLIFLDIVVIGFWLFRKKRAEKLKAFFNLKKASTGVIAGIFAFSLLLCIFNVWPNRASMNEIKQAEQMGILNYETFTIFSSSKKEELVDKNQISQAKIDNLKGITTPAEPKYFGTAKGKNLIIIQMESFQNFLIDLKIDGQEVTPNMNKLVKENTYFKHFYQMVGQGNTSDAEFVVNTSFYIPYNEAATQNYPDKELPSLPKLMRDQGYDTATFHTNVVDFWNRGELYKAIGFNRYYDQKWFGTEDTVFFGPSDEVLYKKTADELDRMQQAGQPFYTQVISMTAHHPFTTPHEKDKIQLPERYQDNMVGDYLRAQSYADYALGQFIQDLKQKGIWDNSVVVIYGDHLGLPMYSLDKHGLELMKEIYGRDYSYIDMMNIPMLIHAPGVDTPAVMNNVGGQVDILPTVANLFGIKLDNHIHFGEDILNQTTYNLLPQRYYLPSGSFLNDQALFIPGVWYNDGTKYPLAKDGVDQALTTESEYNRALELLRLSDSYVQQLPDRVKETKE
ncbi:MAG: LTA synthase family protein [Paenibacillaceae bacterium]|uniref:LTA synthase family protein n=1 Tax=Paenibacillus mellifer TaxID=2937794 RepID=A0A9X2BUD7_9BACL|nr:LTA synthase family protein [Paenibacillus mellifer]MBW4838450.1 LTA synthase family protein [Paenibacillaceae bacterium]MCK8488991.1 LTA synthase family protein [Paenibacillus mellifer]